LTGAARRGPNVARRQKLEVLIGLFGSLMALALVAAVVGMVRDNPSVATSLVLLGASVALGLTIRAHRRA
jgi:hypothetical protein